MENNSSSFRYFVIALLTANLGLSIYIAFKPQTTANTEQDAGSSSSAISSKDATALADRIVPLYNANNENALYDQFDELAKVQISKEQLIEQLSKLGTIIGKIDSYVYSHAVTLGTEGGRTYYKLIYKVRLSGGPFSQGEMTLTVTTGEKGLGLYGLFVNGTSRQSGP